MPNGEKNGAARRALWLKDVVEFELPAEALWPQRRHPILVGEGVMQAPQISVPLGGVIACARLSCGVSSQAIQVMKAHTSAWSARSAAQCQGR